MLVLTTSRCREFLEQGLLTEEEASGIRRLGFDDPDCLDGYEDGPHTYSCRTSELGEAHPEDWWAAYATSDDEDDPKGDNLTYIVQPYMIK